MINIKVIGAGCPDCTNTYNHARDAAKELNLDVELEKVEDLIDIVKLGVMSSPSLMVDGKLVVAGYVPSKDEVKKILEENIK